MKSSESNTSNFTDTTESKSYQRQADLVKQINHTLKHDLRLKVKIGIDRRSVYLQYSDGTKQRKISPKDVTLSTAGIYRAKDLAVMIDNALRSGLYSDYWLETTIYKRGVDKPVVIAVGDVLRDFSSLWLASRTGDKDSTDRQKNSTLKGYRNVLGKAVKLSKCKDNEVFSAAIAEQLLSAYEHGSMRHRLVTIIKLIVKLFKLKIEVDYGDRKPRTVIKREIPTDLQIIETYHGIANTTQLTKAQIDSASYYQWVYGILATYGLRPHELFAIDLAKSFRPNTDYWLFLDGSLCDGIKTGDRAIPPLQPQWVELFDLANIPECTIGSKSLKSRGTLISGYFKANGLGLPYNLRHAYGIRSKQYMSPIDAASCMGHSLHVHTRIYHSHESLDNKLASIRAGMIQRGYL